MENYPESGLVGVRGSSIVLCFKEGTTPADKSMGGFFLGGGGGWWKQALLVN